MTDAGSASASQCDAPTAGPLSTIATSASCGWPGSPKRADHAPSCMTPRPASAASSQCWASVTPSPPAYSKARRISCGSSTPTPSSVNIRTPSAAISAIGASSFPARPTVIAPATWTSHQPGATTERQHLRHDRRVVDRGRRVRHREHRGISAERGRTRPGLDRLRRLVARLAEVRVEVDEARADPAARCNRAPSPPRAP